MYILGYIKKAGLDTGSVKRLLLGRCFPVRHRCYCWLVAGGKVYVMYVNVDWTYGPAIENKRILFKVVPSIICEPLYALAFA